MLCRIFISFLALFSVHKSNFSPQHPPQHEIEKTRSIVLGQPRSCGLEEMHKTKFHCTRKGLLRMF